MGTEHLQIAIVFGSKDAHMDVLLCWRMRDCNSTAGAVLFALDVASIVL